jgi:hypothetical protein
VSREERIALALQTIHQERRVEYDAIAKPIKERLGSIPNSVLDLEIYLTVKDPKKARELILEGDEIRQGGAGRDEAYLAAIAKVAPAYERFKKNSDTTLNYRSWSVVITNHWGYLSQGNRANFSLRQRKNLSL